MSWVDKNKGAGPWIFTEQPDKWGYLPNPRWSGQADAQAFCENKGLPLDLPDEHLPCGHWHKEKVSEEPFPSGRWVAAMQQPGTPYIYVYDILQKAVIRIDTSEIPVFVSGRLELDSAYALDYDMGQGNPGGQRGGYCMNKDATRIWYLFTESNGDRSDAELIEVDISKTVMKKVGSALFPNLVPSEAYPSDNNERINDGCSDDTHTYWCTNLIAGRIIKIRNSDHSIVDDHYFSYPLECGGGSADEPIATIDVNKNTEKLYWVYCRDHAHCTPVYNACRHLVRADFDLVPDKDEVICGAGGSTPEWQNMIRIYSNYVLCHRAYHPFSGILMKRTLNFSTDDTIKGIAGAIDYKQWGCIKDHYAELSNRPISGANYPTYWSIWDEQPGGNVWQAGKAYHNFIIKQRYLQNILGVKNDKLFTLMHLNALEDAAYLYCIDFSDMTEKSKLDVTLLTGHGWIHHSDDWHWSSTSAMNQQTGVIVLIRYNHTKKVNYVACFDASPSLGFLCDVPLYSVRHDSGLVISNEPQSWPFEGFTPPEIPEEDPPVYIILPPGEDPGPGEEPYVPPPPPPPEISDNVPIIQSGFQDLRIYIGPKETLFYKFVAAVTDPLRPIIVISTPGSDQPRTVHILIKRGSKPTIAEFEMTWPLSPSLAGTGAYADLYWYYSTGSAGEMVKINKVMGERAYYIMMYNTGRASVRNQQLTLSYYN